MKEGAEARVRNWGNTRVMGTKSTDGVDDFAVTDIMGYLIVEKQIGSKVVLSASDSQVIVVTDESNLRRVVTVHVVDDMDRIDDMSREVDLEDVVKAIYNPNWGPDNKIAAIKVIRMLTRWGLKDSKDFVEDIYAM